MPPAGSGELSALPAGTCGVALRVGDARAQVPELEPVQLVVTSPPYPMIEMWDAGLSQASPAVAEALQAGDGPRAFEAMHRDVLDPVWAACFERLNPGGWLCINIGDATRSLGGRFRLYSNHARILQACQHLGFDVLPDILWHKPTNAPNRFMGSGMLPGNAYVTYEHEYVLVLRKGANRRFSAAERSRRQQSAYFWEERNQWFSDVWKGLTGVRQKTDAAVRKRTAAFPLELPLRLVQMFSIHGDRVLDPFAGTGTTLVAAAMVGRHADGVELSSELARLASDRVAEVPRLSARYAGERVDAHAAFVDRRLESGRPFKHLHIPSGVPVVTAQEKRLVVPRVVEARPEGVLSWRLSWTSQPLKPPQQTLFS